MLRLLAGRERHVGAVFPRFYPGLVRVHAVGVVEGQAMATFGARSRPRAASERDNPGSGFRPASFARQRGGSGHNTGMLVLAMRRETLVVVPAGHRPGAVWRRLRNRLHSN